MNVHLVSPKTNFTTYKQLSSEETKYPILAITNEDITKRFIAEQFNFKLTFEVTEVDEDGNEEDSYEDEYPLDKVKVSVKDYIGKQALPQGQFMNAWEMIKKNENCTEKMETFQISFSTMKDAVEGVINFFSMSVCEDSDKITEGAKMHNIFLAGTFYGMYPVLIRGQIGFNSQYGCVLRVGIRSLNNDVMDTVLACIE